MAADAKLMRFGLWRSLASALAWGARGREFKSPQPDQIPQRLTNPKGSESLSLASTWSPKWAPADAGLPSGLSYLSRSLSLSSSTETRHSRHLCLKLLMALSQSLSGKSVFPTRHPTKRRPKPDNPRETCHHTRSGSSSGNVRCIPVGAVARVLLKRRIHCALLH